MYKFREAIFLPLALCITFLATTASICAVSSTPSSSAGKTVTIAEPKPYRSTAIDKLGVNESNKGLTPGDNVEEITIADMFGKPYEIRNAWQDKPALIIFYRGGWCPFCNMQVRELAVNYDKFQAAGVQPVLISVDEPDKTAMMSAKYNIPFPVLSDPSLIAHRAFNVVLDLDAATLEKYQQYGINLQDWSGKKHNKIAVASAFLVDQSGRILVSHAPTDYRTRPSIEQLLELIAQHKKIE
ncbi:MAG: peroxiredoxin-like family protein [Pseudomonadales bacterium]